MAGLRSLAWRGGITLTLRQVSGMAVSFAGLVVLARLIGPAAYGIYVSAFALHAGLVVLFQWGVDVYLIRSPSEPTRDEVDQAATLALGLGGLGALAAWPAGWAAEAWIGIDGVATAVTTLFLGMPLQMAALVPSALLQRRMAYGRVAWAELAGQLALYGGAVAAALAGGKLAAPLIGWWLQQVTMTGLLIAFSGYRPRPLWNPALVRRLAGFGAGYALSVWSWQLRNLVNPLIVARLLGPEAAAGVAVAVRLAESLSFMKTVLWRISVSALGRLQGEPARLSAAVGEGMRLQVLAVGPLLVGFAVLAPWLVPLAFGKDWSGAAVVFPFLCLAWLVNAAFSLQASALYVLGRNGDVTLFHLTHVAVLAAAAAAAVPSLGLVGYGVAELAAIASYVVLAWLARTALGEVESGLAMTWVIGFGAAAFYQHLGPAALAVPVAVLILPSSRRAFSRWWAQIKELRHV
ncbi:MAG: oligosaccharide flippase family protein [Solirubrobacterales bacterium]